MYNKFIGGLVELKEVEITFSVEIDEGGFCVNCDMEDFSESTVPAYLIMIAKKLCEQQGSNFGRVLQSAMRIMKDDDNGAQA